MFAPIIAAVAPAFVSAIIHPLGLLMLLYWHTQQWPKIEANFGPGRNVQLFLALIGVILVLHVLKIGVWAGCYFWQHCLPDFETSFYFSGATCTTLGYGDVVLPRPWRLVGVLESLTGVLLMGWSAAFFFAMVSRLFDLRIRYWQQQRKPQ